MSKKKLNVVDYIILAAVILVVLVAAFLLKNTLNQYSQGNADSTVTFEVFLQERDAYLGEAAQDAAGSELLLSQKEKDYGTLKAVKVVPAVRIVQDRVAGTFREEAVPNKVDITLVIEAKATVTDSAITVGQTKIQTGTIIAVSNKNFVASGYIFDITEE